MSFDDKNIFAMTQGGLPDPLRQITYPVYKTIQRLGWDSDLKATLTANIPQIYATEDLEGSFFDELSKDIDSIIRNDEPLWGGFASVFNIVASTASAGNNIQNLVSGSAKQIFRNAVLNDGNFPGFDPDQIIADRNFIDVDTAEAFAESELLVTKDRWKTNIENSIELTGSLPDVLTRLVESDEINGFASLFRDYQSYTTLGFGELSSNLYDLGFDLYQLGRLGDFDDLLNLGTPKQVTRQIIEKGLGISTGLLQTLLVNGIDPNTLFEDSKDEEIRYILNSINDRSVLALVASTFEITVRFDNLGDLADPAKLLNKSRDKIRFVDFRDIAPVILMMGGNGNIKTYRDLGLILSNIETVPENSSLLDEYTPVRFDELDTFTQTLPPNSWFSSDGPTIADFIGSAAGYVHERTFPKMAELYEKIFSSSYLDEFLTLYQALTSCLNGEYISGSSIIVPSTAKYTFGTYYAMDEAALAIISAIESELSYIEENIANDEPEIYSDLTSLINYYITSVSFLNHERTMRARYNVRIGEARASDNFYSDGSTLSFPLTRVPQGNIIVYVEGQKKIKIKKNWEYDSETNSVIFPSAPNEGKIIEIEYDTGNIPTSTRTIDAWNFASQLQNFALQTGYGNAAEYLNRIITDDRQGHMIQSYMMQSRNKILLNRFGIPGPSFGDISDSEASTDTFNFVDLTGIWSTNVSRAGEIFLQNTQGVTDAYQYKIRKIIENKDSIYLDSEVLLRNIVRSLLYFDGENIIAGELMAGYYLEDQNSDTSISVRLPDNWLLIYTNTVADGGYVLGSFREIISRMMAVEGLSDDYFNIDLSAETERYLDNLGVDFVRLIRVIQRLLTNSVSANLGITEGDAIQIFGQPSVTKLLLQNIADSY